MAIRKRVPSAGSGSSGAWAKGPMYFIQGRQSADIIKTGGEKVSALEVEREMLGVAAISECAVVALPSEAWGQKVAAVVVLSEEGKTAGKGGKPFGAMDLRRALKDRLVAYKIPQDMKVVESIPRNAMGKSKSCLVLCSRPLCRGLFGYGLHGRNASCGINVLMGFLQLIRRRSSRMCLVTVTRFGGAALTSKRKRRRRKRRQNELLCMAFGEGKSLVQVIVRYDSQNVYKCPKHDLVHWRPCLTSCCRYCGRYCATVR